MAKAIETFSLSLKNADTREIRIKPNDINLREFKDVAIATNKILDDRKKAEESLRESNQILSSVLEHTHMSVALLDPQFNFILANQAYADTGKQEPSFFPGKNHFDLYPHEENQAIFQRVVDTGEPFFVTDKHFEYPDQPERGLTYWDWSLSPVKDDTEKVTGLVLSLVEATERMNLEAQLQQAQKMESIGTLAGDIAYDFNNLLFPIVGNTEILLEDIPEDSPLRSYLNNVYNAALQAKGLVKQILAFTSHDRHEIKLMRMQPVIKDALKLIRSTIPTSIELKHTISHNCGIIEADPAQIHQVVMNLATNVYHAMEDTGGELEIGLKQIELGEPDLPNPDMAPGSYACLTVADTGTSIDENIREKILDPYFTTKEYGKCTGMGLSIVHGIVLNAGGNIQVYSELGEGTEFHVYLPIVQNSFEQHEILSEEPIQRGTKRILLVDDEDAIVFIEKQMLERLGYSVVSRTSSVEALEAFRANPDKFDMVITDMDMTNMSGDKLSSELIKIRANIPIILCTRFSKKIPEAKSIGIKGFLMKPIMMKAFSNMIRQVLDNTENSSQQ